MIFPVPHVLTGRCDCPPPPGLLWTPRAARPLAGRHVDGSRRRRAVPSQALGPVQPRLPRRL